MRFLHAGLSDADHRSAGTRAAYHRRRADRRALVQSVPLHRLSEHRESRVRRSRRNPPGAVGAGARTESRAMAPAAVRSKTKHVGASLTRLEDRPLLTGRGRFAADISFPHQLHMRIVRSNFARGRLRAIDAAAALAQPGVHTVWAAADVADIPPIDFRLSRIEGLEAYRQRLFADDFVRYVGEPVAAVFAADPYIAEDAAELVTLDIEELPPLLRADEPPG